MSIELISLLSFLGLTAVSATVMLFLRDSKLSASVEYSVTRPSQSLRRARNVFDEEPATSVTGKFDQAFARLVLESGYDTAPATAYLLLVLGGLVLGGVLLNVLDNPPVAVLGVGGGMIVGVLVLSMRRRNRMRRIQNELPDVVELLSRAVRAGQSVDQAIGLVARESGAELSSEFARCASQMQMGRSLGAVMTSMGRRIRLVDIQLLAMTLMVHRRTGGNLAQTLERMSDVMRDRLTARRQMRASTGAGRTSSLLIAAVSPVAYLATFLLVPEHFGILYTDPTGRLLLAIAFVLEIVGVVWVLRLIRDDS